MEEVVAKQEIYLLSVLEIIANVDYLIEKIRTDIFDNLNEEDEIAFRLSQFFNEQKNNKENTRAAFREALIRFYLHEREHEQKQSFLKIGSVGRSEVLTKIKQAIHDYFNYTVQIGISGTFFGVEGKKIPGENYFEEGKLPPYLTSYAKKYLADWLIAQYPKHELLLPMILQSFSKFTLNGTIGNVNIRLKGYTFISFNELLALLLESEQIRDHLCDIDKDTGNTLLHIAIQSIKQENEIVSVINILFPKKLKETIKETIKESGIDILNVINHEGRTPLIEAINFSYYDLALAILECGAKPEVDGLEKQALKFLDGQRYSYTSGDIGENLTQHERVMLEKIKVLEQALQPSKFQKIINF